MSQTLHVLKPEPTLHPVTAATLQELRASCLDMREEVLKYDEVRNAFAIYQHLKDIEKEIAVLVDMAGAQVETLMTRRMS